MALTNLISSHVETSFTYLGKEVFIEYDEFFPNKLRVFLKNPEIRGHTLNMFVENVDPSQDLADVSDSEDDFIQSLIDLAIKESAFESFIANSDQTFADMTAMIRAEQAELEANPPIIEPDAPPEVNIPEEFLPPQ